MRSIRLCVALAACLVITGCTTGHATVQSANASQPVVIAKIIPTATSQDAQPSAELLKGSDVAPSPTTTPVARAAATPESAGPLSCVEQRMRALRNGKVLPTDQCS
jgi:hypothetical protein